MNRRIALLLAAGLVGLAGLGLWLVTPPKHNITADAVRQIKVGVTEQEVVQILGVPPGDYGLGLGSFDDGIFSTTIRLSLEMEAKGHPKEWLAGAVAVRVTFDDQGQVMGHRTGPVYPHPVTYSFTL